VNLVDEEDIMAFQVGEDCCQVAGALDGRAGRRPDIGADLSGDDMSQTGLTQAGRAVEEYVVQGFLAAPGGGDGDIEVFLGLVLSGKLGQAPWSQAGIQRCILGTGFPRYDASYFDSPPWIGSATDLTITFLRRLRQGRARR
jgi:hypothetical protein